MTCINFRSFRRPFTTPPKPWHYTKEFQENTKENYESGYFEKFYVLNLQNVIEWHLAAILRSRPFFLHPYCHIDPWHMSDAIYVNYVINAKNDIIDIYGIGHISWINMQYLELVNLRCVEGCMTLRIFYFARRSFCSHPSWLCTDGEEELPPPRHAFPSGEDCFQADFGPELCLLVIVVASPLYVLRAFP